MSDQGNKSAKKRGGESNPHVTALNTSMGQGSEGYKCGCPPCDLAAQMGQGSKPHHSFDKEHPPTLGSVMGQR